MTVQKFIILVLGTFALAACASPKVEYSVVSGPDRDGKSKFQLPTSMISFTHPKTKAGIEKKDQVNISSVPVPDDATTFAMDSTDWYQNWGVDTKVQVSYRKDTTLIESVGVEVKDRRQEFAQTLVEIVVGGASLMSLASEDSHKNDLVLPKSVDIASILKQTQNNYGCTYQADDSDASAEVTCSYSEGSFQMDIKIGKRPEDSFAMDATFYEQPADPENKDAARKTKKFKSKTFMYSACRTAGVKLVVNDDTKAAKGRAFEASLVVADSRYLQTLRFPDKGKVTVGASCGANAVASDAGLPSALDYINTLIKQAKVVRDGLK